MGAKSKGGAARDLTGVGLVEPGFGRAWAQASPFDAAEPGSEILSRPSPVRLGSSKLVSATSSRVGAPDVRPDPSLVRPMLVKLRTSSESP